MKRYFIFLLFFLNLAFAFQEGKLALNCGMEMQGQTFGDETGENSSTDWDEIWKDIDEVFVTCIEYEYSYTEIEGCWEIVNEVTYMDCTNEPPRVVNHYRYYNDDCEEDDPEELCDDPCECVGDCGDENEPTQNNGNTNANDNNTNDEQNRETVENLVAHLKSMLALHGINTFGIEICAANARVINGKVEVCSKFLNYEFRDQISIIWHEIYHINNDLLWDRERVVFSEPVVLDNIPSHIENYIKDVLLNDCPPIYIESEYLREISFNIIYSSDFYQNEINAYQNEINTMTNVSSEYDAERNYMLWYYEQLLNISLQYYNK